MASKAKLSIPNKIGQNPKQLVKSASGLEPLKCTGRFKDDFENICLSKNLKYVPDVIPRSKRPGSSLQNMMLSQQNVAETSLGKVENKKSTSVSKGKPATNMEIEHEIEQNPEFIELPPKSFVVKDPLEYFKPKIHVEMDNSDKLDSVTEVHIKGWRLEKPIIEVLNLCLPAIEQLHTLNLWNAGLDEEAVRLISSLLPNCANLKTLILDNNPIESNIYDILLYEENSAVQNLSLRNNLINDDAAKYIGLGLGDVRRSNTKLLTLNLNNNLIGDEGAISLAKGLRTNRTLLVLNLACNNIGDKGAKAFAEVISQFPMSFDEIVYRRYVMSGRNFDKPIGENKDNRPNSQKSVNANTNSNNNSTISKDDKKDKKDKGVKKSGDTSNLGGTNSSLSSTHQKNSKDQEKVKPKKEEAKGTRKASITADAKSKLNKPSSKTGKRTTKEIEEANAAFLEITPLADLTEFINEKLWIVGNRTLINLNLSRNGLSDISINYFLDALNYQKTYLELHKSQGTGLLRLVLNRNNFNSENDPLMFKLSEVLKTRDPVYKLNTNGNMDNETGSISGKDSALARPVPVKSGKH